MSTTTETPLETGKRIRLETIRGQLEEMGAKKIRVSELGVTTAVIDGTDVIVSDVSPIIDGLCDITYTDGSKSFGEPIRAGQRSLTEYDEWTSFTPYRLVTRAHWTPQGGNYVRVNDDRLSWTRDAK